MNDSYMRMSEQLSEGQKNLPGHHIQGVMTGRRSPASFSPFPLHPREEVTLQPFQPEGPAPVPENEFSWRCVSPSPQGSVYHRCHLPLSSQCFLVTISAANVKRNKKDSVVRKEPLTLFITRHGDRTSLKSNLSNHRKRKEGLLKPQKDKNRKNVKTTTDTILMLATASFLLRVLRA